MALIVIFVGYIKKPVSTVIVRNDICVVSTFTY